MNDLLQTWGPAAAIVAAGAAGVTLIFKKWIPQLLTNQKLWTESLLKQLDDERQDRKEQAEAQREIIREIVQTFDRRMEIMVDELKSANVVLNGLHDGQKRVESGLRELRDLRK